MTVSIPDNEPSELRAGDTWKWTRTLGDYPASTPWTLKYRFKNAAGGFEITASASGDGYSVTVTAAASAAYAAGSYDWIGWVENSDASEKYTIDTGTLLVLPNLRSGTATAAQDVRSHAQTVLDAVEAVIENRATLDQEAYEIAGRSLKRTPLAELFKFRRLYRAEVRAEKQAEAIRNGTAVGGRIQFRI